MRYLSIIFILLFSCAELDLSTTAVTCQPTTSNTYSKGDQLQELIERYSKLGIPGISVALRKGNQTWAGAAGFASIEQRVAMQTCHLLYSQSVAKTYTAVTILQLKEKGKINLDQSIRTYLPERIWKRIEYSDAITVRMLLNHTSGIFDYAYDYGQVMYLLNNGDKVWSRDFLLDFFLDKKPVFKPGEKYSYCNSGYTLLAIIAEEVSGMKHSALIRQNILNPLQLQHTFYKEEVSDAPAKGLVNSYIDRFSTGHFENISTPQMNNILSMMGDDSIVASAGDYLQFLDGLFAGKLISVATLAEMQQTVSDKKGKPAYGLGLDYVVDNNVVGWGHSGGGLGAGCVLYYYPEKDITLFLGVNMCTLLEGPATDQIQKMRNDIYSLIFAD